MILGDIVGDMVVLVLGEVVLVLGEVVLVVICFYQKDEIKKD